jgi:hypothetical protein
MVVVVAAAESSSKARSSALTTKWNDTDSPPVCVFLGPGLCR